ncbi:MAG: NAD(+) diphosphatase [Betaproteobacteria bacterium]
MSDLAYWILRCGDRVWSEDAIPGNVFPFCRAGDLAHPESALLVGSWRGELCYAVDVGDFPDDRRGKPVTVRALFAEAGAEAFAMAGRATQLLDWQRNHRYCGRCGELAERKASEFAMQCPACGLISYPRISPAVMVLVRRGDELLLARSPHFASGMFSALAGFVEAGETLEECAHREVREEVGVEIANLRYFRSQSWPFPNSLMVAFFADYAGGTLCPDPSEIEKAGWFHVEALPQIPHPVSIARQLIDAAREQRG